MIMENEDIKTTKGDEKGSIDSLIAFLKDAKNKGATHYRMDWSHDPVWSFKWFVTYRMKSNNEVVKEKIKELESKLNTLK
jgi:hypothetical protein